MIAGPIFCSWMSRAARSGTLSPKGFQFDVREARAGEADQVVEHREAAPAARPSSYCGGSQTASLRTCGSPSGLPLRIFDVCSSTTSVPAEPLGRLSAIGETNLPQRSSSRGPGPCAASLSQGLRSQQLLIDRQPQPMHWSS